MSVSTSYKNRGYLYAIIAALLFGASTPAAKFLLTSVSPWLLAGLFYLGSGIGLAIIYAFRQLVRRKTQVKGASLRGKDWGWLALAVLAGGIIGPVLLMGGLRLTSAASASLLLNLEAVFTALLAWFVFKEHFDRRIALGMLVIVIGSLLLSWTGTWQTNHILGMVCIGLACFCWALDNNITRKVSAADAVQIVMIKSLVAGMVNVSIAVCLGGQIPSVLPVISASLVGFVGYGLSLLCFVLALRHIGTSRTGAYFSLAPFAGTALAVFFLGDALSWQLLIASSLMGLGVYLHLTERHDHEHTHEEIEHSHEHSHDEHHQHDHGSKYLDTQPHTHWHKHEPICHSHPHYPDVHHRHEH